MVNRLVLSSQTFRCDTNRLRLSIYSAGSASLGIENVCRISADLLWIDLLARSDVDLRPGSARSGLAVALSYSGGESFSHAFCNRARPGNNSLVAEFRRHSLNQGELGPQARQ